MRVAIIGAGFSGMLAAYLLEKKGVDVTVYEKEAVIGGHCQTLVSKDLFVELGTVFCFSEHIKELLLELDISYSERFTYRNFVDENYNKVEHISHQDVSILLEELHRLENLLHAYSDEGNHLNYGKIHDLMIPLGQFLKDHNLNTISQVIAPPLSSYGFGDINEIQAFYALNVFNLNTINAFIRGDKLLFIDKGATEIIRKLSQNISDIRYSIEVKRILPLDDQVKIETDYDSELFDKVLITAKLPDDVIEDSFYNELMKNIETNPYITCAYEVENKNIVTTYFKSNLGKKERIQFFHTYKQKDKTVLVAYAYGIMNASLINDITKDLKNAGVHVKHLITAKQWYIFPHLKAEKLTQDLYTDLAHRQQSSRICLIGSLVSKPSISNLYASIKDFINRRF
ncbi:MAG TPA: FAD-dependent oxidoreductase [Proteiniclasticum sp.]|nr:FAD-dependent oxidoreductase [Proteiniclasticum sp.]